jgi:cytochrome b561
MNDATAPALRYDRRSIVLHWITAGLVGLLWMLGQTIDWFPKVEPRIAARSVHIALGISLALVLVWRIGWRLRAGATLPPIAGWLGRIAMLMHQALYLLLIVTLALGVANAWVRGDTLFHLFTIPAFDPGNKSLRATVEDWHGLAANILLFAALFHAAAGLLHHYLSKDDVLRRMLPLRPRR